jgi:hypothetical protein
MWELLGYTIDLQLLLHLYVNRSMGRQYQPRHKLDTYWMSAEETRWFNKSMFAVRDAASL